MPIILGDLFAARAIALDKPFEVGDAIKINGLSGTVEQIGLNLTCLRSPDGEQIVIANADLLHNLSTVSTPSTPQRVRLARCGWDAYLLQAEIATLESARTGGLW